MKLNRIQTVRAIQGAAAVVLASLASVAVALEYNVVDAAHSKLNFRYTEMGVAIDGGFKQFTVQLNFDPAKPEAAHVSVVVPFAGIDAGAEEANSEVTGKEWLDTAHFPTAHFESTGVKAVSAGHYLLSGTLSIKGHTHPITLPVAFTMQGNQGVLDGTVSINRNDFAIGEGVWADASVIATAIQVSFKVLAGTSK